MAIELLEHTLTEAAKLPEDDQRAPADWILLELQFGASVAGGLRHISANWVAWPKRRKPSSTQGRQDRWNSQDTSLASLATCTMADTKNEDLPPCPRNK